MELFSANPQCQIDWLDDPLFIAKEVEVGLLRLDQIDPLISGNKWYKLKYNLLSARTQGLSAVLSFGGAYSNHIHALAWAGKGLGLKTIAVIRGEPEYAGNPTLADALKWGMELHFVDRKTYRKRHDPNYVEQLRHRFGEFLLVPEGGSNALAVKGSAEILSPELIDQFQPSAVVLACGTGGTLAGLVAGNPSLNILGIPVLKGGGFLRNDIASLLEESSAEPGNWNLDLGGHFGGYGRVSDELRTFIGQFKVAHGIQLDQVYTGKMMLRLMQLISEGAFPAGSRILAIHTGGLQGLRGMD